MNKKQKNSIQTNNNNEVVSGYTLALRLAKKMREQGRAEQEKASIAQDKTHSKEAKK